MTHLAVVQACEAAYALSRQAKDSLPVKPRQRAVDFILEFGTNLQRERLLYHFPWAMGWSRTFEPKNLPSSPPRLRCKFWKVPALKIA